MDRTIPPGIPAGEDAGAVVGVVGPDSMEHNRIVVSSKDSLAKRRVGRSRDQVVPLDRIGVPEVDLVVVLAAGRIVPSSAVRER